MKSDDEKGKENGRKYVNILGINVLSSSEREVLASVRENITHNKFFITTPNPELVIASTKNPSLKLALNSSDYPVPDGIGLSQASKFLSMTKIKTPIVREVVYFFQGLLVGVAIFINPKWLTNNLNIIKGRVLFSKLIELSAKNKWKVFFLGGESNEAAVAASKLKIINKKLKIETFQGPIVDNNAEPVTEVDRKIQSDAIEQINKFKPQLLFVAMKNPKQEIWIHKNLKKLNVNGAMTVGGTFRYVSGLSPLPPKRMGEYGLEWVYRLITEPYRIKRIFNAFPIFPLRVFWFKATGR